MQSVLEAKVYIAVILGPASDCEKICISMCDSQEHPSIAKTTVDGEKVTRPAKQYSAVASRYAAPLASKKQLGTADGPNAGHSNVNKLPFITGTVYATFFVPSDAIALIVSNLFSCRE